MPSLEDLLIIIPARGGSKGILRKNIRPLAGHPLIEWSFRSIREAGMDSAKCLLSTDDEEIADVGRHIGIDVPFLRSPAAASDTATLPDVAFDVIERLPAQRLVYCLMVLPTHPFRLPALMRRAYDRFDDPAVDGVMAVRDIHRSLGTLFYEIDKNSLTPIGTPVAAERRQDVRPIYTPSGCFFYARIDALYEQKTFYTRNVFPIATGHIDSTDLDSEEEWKVADAVARSNLSWWKM
jgi:CMP-N-acetylneuraminic acid synthetase